MKQQITGKLAAARRINICVDIWTKWGMSASFFGITAHFFSRSDHKRHRVTIAVKRMPSPHTADRVSELVKTMLQDWEIPEEKVGSVLTDNGSNMVAAFKQQVCSTDEDDMDGRESTAEESNDMYDTEMETGETETRLADEVQKEIDDFDDKEIEHNVAFCQFSRMSCFAHTLQLVIRRFDGIRCIQHVLGKAHTLVSKVNKSTKATERLIQLAQKKLVNACPTRWSSTYLLVDRLLEVRQHLTTVLEELEWNNLQNTDWKQLDSIRDILSPFAIYTSLISGEDFTTVSCVVPILMELKMHLEEMKKKPGLSTAAALLQAELHNRFNKFISPDDDEFDPTFIISTLLDPRYKLVLCEKQIRAAKEALIHHISKQKNGNGTSSPHESP